MLSAFRKTGETSPDQTGKVKSISSYKRIDANTRFSRYSSEIEVTQKKNWSIQLVEKEKTKKYMEFIQVIMLKSTYWPAQDACFKS